jgi:hypothetical protein
MLQGRVTDAETGSGVAGATVVAAHGDSNDAAVSDATGHFHLAVPPGRYRVTVYFNDATVDAGERDVAASGSDPLALALSHAVAVTPGRNPKDCPADASGRVATADDRDAVLAAVLEHYLADPAGVPDGEAVAQNAQVFVASDDSPDVRVTARSIPDRMVLRSEIELRAEANRRRNEVGYVGVSSLEIVGDCATVGIDAGFMMPSGAKSSRTHCGASAVYVRKNGRWTFKNKIYDMCE